MSDEVEDTITETPTGEVAVVPGDGNIPTITPQVKRTFPIRDIKLIADGRRAFTEHAQANNAMIQQALMLYGIITAAADVVKEVNEKFEERKRLGHRIVAATGGRVKDEDVEGYDFDRALIILKPESKPEAPKLVLPGQ